VELVVFVCAGLVLPPSSLSLIRYNALPLLFLPAAVLRLPSPAAPAAIILLPFALLHAIIAVCMSRVRIAAAAVASLASISQSAAWFLLFFLLPIS